VNRDESTSFRASLSDFLVTQFDASSLRMLVRELPGEKDLARYLTYPASLWEMSQEVADLSIEHGRLGDLQVALIQRRSELRGVIEEIWSRPPAQTLQQRVPAPVNRVRTSAVPLLPEGVEERPEFALLRTRLRERHPLIGVAGLPGSGKTTAAIAALDGDVRAALSAVCWLDSDSSTPIQPSDVRAKLVRQLGGTSSPDTPPSRDELAQLAIDVVGDGHLLVVLDDLRGRLDQLAEAARCHPNTSLLFTMADSSVLFALGVRDPIVLGGLPADVGLRVLAHWAGTEASALPLAARELAEAIGLHAQGLRILGTVVAAASDPDAEWSYLQRQLRAHAVSAQALPGIPEANLASLVDQVIDVLHDDERTVVDVLAVLPAATVLDVPSLARMASMDEDPFRRLADSLIRRSLAVTLQGQYGLSAFVHLRARERRGFDDHYREALDRLSPPMPALIWSIVMRDVRMALRLVASSSAESLTQSTEEFGSPFHQAAIHGPTEVLEAMLEHGVDPGAVDQGGFDALRYAAQGGQIDVARLLMKRGASPLRPSGKAHDAVWIALFHKQIATADVLLEGVVLPLPAGADLAGDLKQAVYRGAHAAVERLFALGAPADPDLGPKNTPLLALAISEGHLDVARLMLDQGARFRSGTLAEALVFAAQDGHTALIETLIRAGADLTWTTKDQGRTALAHAAIRGHVEAVQECISAGANVECADAQGWTPLHLAAAFHHAGVVRALAATGANLEAQGPGGERALGLCILQAGPGVSMQSSVSFNEKGLNAASVVIVTDLDPKVMDTVRALLTAGVEVNAANATGRTALHHAAALLQPALADALLAAGARRDSTDAKGQTPLDVARAATQSSGGSLSQLRGDALIRILESH